MSINCRATSRTPHTKLVRVGVVRVDAEGLVSLGQECERLAGELGAETAPPATGLPCQATVTAVQALNAEVKTASNAMAMRMTATGAKLSEGAAGYVSQDEFAASAIETVSPTFRV